MQEKVMIGQQQGMSKERASLNRRRVLTAAVLGAVAILASGATAAGLALSGGGSSTSAVTRLPAPLTAAQVAVRLNAQRFTDCGPHPVGGVADSGTAYLAGRRIGIDTFPSAAQRNAWLKVSADFGIVPADSGSTWVSYQAVDQHATGCG